MKCSKTVELPEIGVMFVFLPFIKLCVSKTWGSTSQWWIISVEAVSEWRTGKPRYEWTCSAPGNVMNSWVASWSQLLSQDITSTVRSDSWLPGVGFDKAWFSCLALASPHLEACLLLPQSDWQGAIKGDCVTIHCLLSSPTLNKIVLEHFKLLCATSAKLVIVKM